MKEATVIIDKLLVLLRTVPGIEADEQVVDSDPQLDEYTPLPVIHLRELDEQPPERHGRDYKRTRRIQIDLYQQQDSTRQERDLLLEQVLKVLYPAPTGLRMEGTRLLSFTVGAIVLEPEESLFSARLTQVPITFDYLSSL